MVATVGKDNPDKPNGVGPWTLCLSEKQRRQLFPRGGGPGAAEARSVCGASACVWLSAQDEIVKITSDVEDVAALEKAQGLARVVHVKKAYRLNRAGVNRQGKDIPVYAVVAERLRPLPPNVALWNRRFMKGPTGDVSLARRLLINEAHTHRESGKPMDTYQVSPDVRELATTTACRRLPDQVECEQFTNEFLDTFQTLFHKGIIWGDHHQGNMMVDENGRWKVVDIGESFAGKPSKRVKPLNGVEMRRVRKLLGQPTIACGQCFSYAYARAQKGGKIVHARVVDPWSKKLYDHAWVEQGGRVYDWQTSQGLGKGPRRKAEFYALYKPTDIRTFDLTSARVNALRHKHYGPW